MIQCGRPLGHLAVQASWFCPAGCASSFSSRAVAMIGIVLSNAAATAACRLRSSSAPISATTRASSSAESSPRHPCAAPRPAAARTSVRITAKLFCCRVGRQRPPVFPAYKRALGSGRSIRFLTLETCQRPPRAVRTPRVLSASAIPRRSRMPDARSDPTIGMTFAASRSASTT